MAWPIASHLASLATPNLYRAPERREYTENILNEKLSPSGLELTLDAHTGPLGMPNPDALQIIVEDYLKTQNDALTQKLSESAPPSGRQKQQYAELDAVRTALKYELLNFTDKVKKFPANTLAETVAVAHTEEGDFILKMLKALDKKTLEFTTGLTLQSPTNTAAAGASDIATTPAVAQEPMTVDTAQQLSSVLDAISAEQTPASTKDEDSEALKTLKAGFADLRTDQHRAAQRRRDRVAFGKTLVGNRRKEGLLTRTFENMGSKAAAGLFGPTQASPEGTGVHMTGSGQNEEVSKICDAMQMLDLSSKDQTAFDTAKENLKTSKDELKKAEKKAEKLDEKSDDKTVEKTNNLKDIEKHKQDIETYNKEIAEYQKIIAAGAVKAAAVLHGNHGSFFGLRGYDPGLTALSGKPIKVTANNQGLGFAIDFPRPILDPSYYTSSEHNSKADLVCLAKLVKESGAKTIVTTITTPGRFKNPELSLRLAQEAWEAALEAGYKEEDVTIILEGKTMTKELLYGNLDEKGKETGKYAANQKHAEDRQKIAESARTNADDKAVEEAPNKKNMQMIDYRTELEEGRNVLAAAAAKLAETAPAEAPSNTGPT